MPTEGNFVLLRCKKMSMLTIEKKLSKCIDKRPMIQKNDETIDVILKFVTPIYVLSIFQANSIFLTSTKIIRTKKKIQKTTSYFRHGISKIMQEFLAILCIN